MDDNQADYRSLTVSVTRLILTTVEAELSAKVRTSSSYYCKGQDPVHLLPASIASHSRPERWFRTI